MPPATRSQLLSSFRLESFALLLFALTIFPGAALSAEAATESESSETQNSLADLSLEELTNLPVSSVNKKAQRAGDVAAAVFVITQDDIRRSGATTIPQALRMVPGLQVAQIDGNKWAISARGFNSRFANRLLVLMDGRTLYTLTFGGVFWDAQDTMIEDIERIEVIRGPGGAVWGANAFSGVINIITKSASQTGGVLLSAETGTNRPYGASGRFGNTEGSTKWRLFAKGFEQNANINSIDQNANDQWRETRIGGRADIEINNTDALQVSAEAYSGKSGVALWDYSSLLIPKTIPSQDEYEGAFATLEWSTQKEQLGRIGVRTIIDYTNRNSLVFDERRTTYDFELQHNLPASKHHDFMWGLGLRHTADATHKTVISVIPASATLTIYSGFLQDEIAMFDDALHVTLGTKIEHSDYIGTQLMPNLRARFSTSDHTVVWAAISRGIRSASRLERDVLVTDPFPSVPPFTAENPTPAPAGVEFWGDPNFSPEKLKAYELGLRHQLNQRVSVDVAAYYNDYTDMRGMRILPTVCAPSMTLLANDPLCVLTATKIIVPAQYSNLLSGNTWGIELTAHFDPLRYWRLVASYAYLNQHFQDNPVSFGGMQLDFAQFTAGLNARNQWTARSSLSLGANWDWDISLRHVGELPSSESEAYTEADSRIAWRPRIDFELSLVGENLLHANHGEFVSDFIDIPPVAIKRSARLQARWSF